LHNLCVFDYKAAINIKASIKASIKNSQQINHSMKEGYFLIAKQTSIYMSRFVSKTFSPLIYQSISIYTFNTNKVPTTNLIAQKAIKNCLWPVVNHRAKNGLTTHHTMYDWGE
jgi:uncharacterized protein YeaC (DUF1315 family)